MTPRSRLLGTAFAWMIAFVAAKPAAAGPVTLTFTGEVTTISGRAPGQLAEVRLGDGFGASLQIDPRDVTPSINGDFVDFPGAVVGDSLQLMLPALGVTSEGARGSIASLDSAAGMTDLVFIAFQFATPASSSADLFQVELVFEDFSGMLFGSGAELLLPTDLSQFDRSQLRIFPIDPATGDVTGEIFATVRTAAASVPEPTATVSSGLGLLALAWLRRRRPAARGRGLASSGPSRTSRRTE